ncbi:MAG: hypothetical protein IJ435_01225 [Clostridia bacterium]|nr:hypothetical protein [Clostridia bacterium]
MKKFIIVFMCLALSAVLLSGCGCDRNGAVDPTEATETVTEEATEAATGEEVELLPIEGSLDMIFSSGAGAWESHISLSPDGSFTGGYHDMDMGSSGEGYEATVYESEFKGKFSNFSKLSDYAYSMTLETVETEKEAGTEKIEDWDGVRVRVVASSALGIADGTDFVLYLPETPTAELDEEFLYWRPGFGEKGETLGCYGLYNIAGETGFFTYE